MKNNNINMDKIFEKAKTLETVIDDNEVRELIASKSAPIAFKSLINNGVKKMTITASIATLLVSGLILINSKDFDKGHDEYFNNMNASNQSQTVDLITIETEKIPGDKEKDIHRSNIEPNYIAANTIRTDNNVDLPKSTGKITGINTIILSYSDLEKYNISYDEKTNVFDVFSGNMKLSIKPNLHTDFKFNEGEVNLKSKISPKLITSSNGNVKIAFMTKNNSHGVQIDSDDAPNRVLYSERIDELPFDANSFDDFPIPKEQINPHTLDSLISIWGGSDNYGRFSINLENLSENIEALRNLKHINMHIDMSSLKDFQYEYDFNLEFDNPDSLKLSKFIFLHNDSLLIPSRDFKHKFDNIDSVVNNIVTKKIDMRINSSFDKIEKDVNDNLKRTQDKLKLMNIRIDMLNDMTVNKLIPIQFDIPNHKSNVIFWFEPTEELLEIVPDELKERIQKELNALNSNKDLCDAEPVTGSETIMDVWRSCSGAVENMMVFPNPTNGPVSVSFKLKEERRVSISLHDLTGKLITQIAPETLINTGEYKENFNLKNISPGMYLLVAQTHYGEQTLQRIIIE